MGVMLMMMVLMMTMMTMLMMTMMMMLMMGMTTGLPADHALGPLAQAAADNVVLVLGVPEDKEWFTSDTVLDTWVLKSVPSGQVRAGLALISCSERKQIIMSCRRC